MATRLYFPSTGASPVSPAFDGAWDDTGSAVRRLATVSPSGSPATTLSAGGGGGAAENVLLAQYASPPLAAQTINGSVKGQVRARQADPDIDAMAQLVIRVIADDGTVRGTLVAAQTEALSSEFTSAVTNRKFPLAAISPVSVAVVVAQEGDRLIVEVGALVADNGLDEVSVQVRDDAASDLPEDETSTANNNPWIEFSATLTFAEEASGASVTNALSPRIGIGL